MNFLCSPELVTAMAFSGDLYFNPLTDELVGNDGKKRLLDPPRGKALPDRFESGRPEYTKPEANQPDDTIPITVDPASDRLELLAPFYPWSGTELSSLNVLIKVAGKCTTDHISAAGPWLKYKGHLGNLSRNTLIGATNAFTGKVNLVKNHMTGKLGTLPDVAFAYKEANRPWLIVADHNYGEGSAREHAALQPRYLGCQVVLARSFARIHETNLKKQGVLPLIFDDPEDYERITSDATISTVGLTDLVRSGRGSIDLIVSSSKGEFRIKTRHTMSPDQLDWFKYGSALNLVRSFVEKQ
jgi:aconitase A